MENPAPLTCALSERVATVGEGIKDSLPIVISYLPVAFAFGLNATRLGFTPLESLFFSCIIYAGASQFVITAMLAAGSSLWVAALTVMAMDVRHVLYGPSLRSRIHTALNKKKTALWAFGLTDEVFAAATARLVRDNRRWSENWMLGLAFTSWASWVCGTLAGAWSGNGLLVAHEDAQSLADALALVLTQVETGERLARTGAQDARELYTLERMISRYEALFSLIMAGQRGHQDFSQI